MHAISDHIDCKIFYDPIFIRKTNKLRYAKYVRIGKTVLGWILIEYDEKLVQNIDGY
jgi:hypothetical protein